MNPLPTGTNSTSAPIASALARSLGTASQKASIRSITPESLTTLPTLSASARSAKRDLPGVGGQRPGTGATDVVRTGPVVLDLAPGQRQHGRRVVERIAVPDERFDGLAGGLGGGLGRLPGGVPGLQRAHYRGGGIRQHVDLDRLGRDAEVARD